VAAVADVLAELADHGRALEFGIGTGRIALPLAARGVEVHGIDLSRAMVARLRAKPGGAELPVTIGDFATAEADGTFSLAMRGDYVDFTDGRGEYRTMPFRYVWPAELDLMAQLAGMRLRDRWAGWTREPFTSESRQHVSVWEKPSR
jgi:SAM-dependent methyltransferase